LWGGREERFWRREEEGDVGVVEEVLFEDEGEVDIDRDTKEG
jgi:hypothetical protein